MIVLKPPPPTPNFMVGKFRIAYTLDFPTICQALPYHPTLMLLSVAAEQNAKSFSRIQQQQQTPCFISLDLYFSDEQKWMPIRKKNGCEEKSLCKLLLLILHLPVLLLGIRSELDDRSITKIATLQQFTGKLHKQYICNVENKKPLHFTTDT